MINRDYKYLKITLFDNDFWKPLDFLGGVLDNLKRNKGQDWYKIVDIENLNILVLDIFLGFMGFVNVKKRKEYSDYFKENLRISFVNDSDIYADMNGEVLIVPIDLEVNYFLM